MNNRFFSRQRNMIYRLTVAGFLAVGSACRPGFSINLISQTPVAVVLEYSHSVGGELQATIRTAETRCQQYGKHARLNGQPVRLNQDRSVATFDCVP